MQPDPKNEILLAYPLEHAEMCTSIKISLEQSGQTVYVINDEERLRLEALAGEFKLLIMCGTGFMTPMTRIAQFVASKRKPVFFVYTRQCPPLKNGTMLHLPEGTIREAAKVISKRILEVIS